MKPNKPLEDAVERTIKQYGDSEDFLKLLNPSVQSGAALNLERVYFGTAPSLTLIKLTYSIDILKVWLKLQLNSLNDAIAVKEKLELEQLDELSKLIIIQYPYLKASEIMLFIHRYKCGLYGQSYGAIDPQKIMCGMVDFVKQRRAEMSAIESRKKLKELEIKKKDWAESAITREKHEANHLNDEKPDTKDINKD